MNWNQVVPEIGPRLYRYFAASFSSETASDLTQETLVRLVTKYEDNQFDPAQGSLIMFAYGIARLVRLEAWKAQPPEDTYGDPKEYDRRVVQLNGSHDSQAETQIAALRICISELNEVQQQIVLLHIDEELSLQEIGTIVGLPLNTVKSHIHRAKENLREKLTPDGELENG